MREELLDIFDRLDEAHQVYVMEIVRGVLGLQENNSRSNGTLIDEEEPRSEC